MRKKKWSWGREKFSRGNLVVAILAALFLVDFASDLFTQRVVGGGWGEMAVGERMSGKEAGQGT